MFAACGGTVFAVDDGGSNEGGLDGGSPSCPAAVPADNSACTIEALQCEYGNAPQPMCDTMATCTNKAWHVSYPPKGGSCAVQGRCPPTYKDVPQGAACADAYPSICTYPEGTCGCEPFMGGPVPLDAGGAAHWSCDAPKAGCPATRPRLGSSCHPEGMQCDYSPCVLPTGSSVICQTGTWHEQMFACAQ